MTDTKKRGSDGTNQMKLNLFYFLAGIRDKDWMPDILVRAIDWVRYEVCFPKEQR